MSRETETVGDVRNEVLYSHCEYTPNEVLDYIDRVADAVRREGVGTCHQVDKPLTDGCSWMITVCSECGHSFGLQGCVQQGGYCPNCGRKVER